MPESISTCGELNAPPHRITSRSAVARSTWPPFSYPTPVARLPCMVIRATSARTSTDRFFRFIAGCR
jgi:hypothetical protein